MYVETLVNGKANNSLVDTGVTCNFVSNDETKRLELQTSKEGGWLKAINSTAKPSHGIPHEVAIYIGSWEGRVNFTLTPMDNFKLVLGMDFLRKVKVMSSPFLHLMVILGDGKLCMVPTITEGSPKTPMLSALQVKKRLKRKEVTYIATLKEEKENGLGKLMPKEIEEVLNEFKDVMLSELPKRLPPRKEEDHKIELESETIPLLESHIGWHHPSWKS